MFKWLLDGSGFRTYENYMVFIIFLIFGCLWSILGFISGEYNEFWVPTWGTPSFYFSLFSSFSDTRHHVGGSLTTWCFDLAFYDLDVCNIHSPLSDNYPLSTIWSCGNYIKGLRLSKPCWLPPLISDQRLGHHPGPNFSISTPWKLGRIGLYWTSDCLTHTLSFLMQPFF